MAAKDKQTTQANITVPTVVFHHACSASFLRKIRSTHIKFK